MRQKAVFISGFIGLLFGVLFAGTLGLDFFGSNDSTTGVQVPLQKDAQDFKLAYNLDSSIYLPVYGSDIYEKIENDETFIVYIGRDTCPYCQQYVPNLMEAAMNQGFTEIYHVDTIDPSNEDFVDMQNVQYTPTTYFVKEGVIVETLIGFYTTNETEDAIINTFK